MGEGCKMMVGWSKFGEVEGELLRQQLVGEGLKQIWIEDCNC